MPGSIEFYYDAEYSNGLGGWVCNGFEPKIEDYLVDCSAKGAEPVGNFYDYNCDGPKTLVSGEVVAHPSTDPVTGTCNSQRVANGNQHQLVGNYVGEEPMNVTLSYCSETCRHYKECSSYYVSRLALVVEAKNCSGTDVSFHFYCNSTSRI